MAALLVAVSFGIVIAVSDSFGVELHEIAGVLLLLLIVLALGAAYPRRVQEPGPVVPLVAAFATLIVMGLLGGLLALGALPDSLGYLPLVPLAVLGLLLLLAVRQGL